MAHLVFFIVGFSLICLGTVMMGTILTIRDGIPKWLTVAAIVYGIFLVVCGFAFIYLG